MFTLAFWKAAGERAVKTFAQTLLAALLAAHTLTDAPWVPALSAAGLAAVLSVLTSLISSKVGDAGPSLAGETLTAAVAAEASPKSPTGALAGPAADVPEGRPVEVTEPQLNEGI
jgi:hypothetical protein